MTDESLLWRAQTYALLALLLKSAPEQALLDNLAQLEISEPTSPMGAAWHQLSEQAAISDAKKLEEEFAQLFIGVTHGELSPYGSFYQTGFLMEEPLAILRTDLAKLGLERQEEVKEPEDHIAAECDVMRLILSAEGTPIISSSEFYQRHLEPWVMRFFTDLADSKEALFYRKLGEFALVFFKLEQAENR
jgi:TorA maturation chaperone TorD